MRLFVLLVALFACLPAPAPAITIPFDVPVVLGPSQAPGVWYPDRYPPAGFSSPVVFQGDNRLLQQINAADAQSNDFYNTQGRKYDLGAGTYFLSIDLYVDPSWASTGRRMAGLWGTGFNATNQVSFYPIVEFTSDSGTPRFRAWNNGLWINLGLPTGFAYDTWQTLSITLAGAQILYQVGNLSASVGANGTTYFGNVMLQGYNQGGVTYDIYWDNLRWEVVPEPASIVLFASVALTLAAFRLRRKFVRL
jgi:hypothetical protein